MQIKDPFWNKSLTEIKLNLKEHSNREQRQRKRRLKT